MFVDPAKDYFAVLGVVPHADPAVVKAAYRALAKKYHPDRQDGTNEQARQKFQDVQEAYELLADDARRRQYVYARAHRQEQHRRAQAQVYRPPIRLFLDDRWDHLVRENPELGRHHARFSFISRKFAQQFKLIILGTRNHRRFNKIAARMERQFYRRHFSYHRDLQKLARRLAARRRRHALRELAREIKGRRLLRPRYKRALVERFETRYLQPARAGGFSVHPMRPRLAPAPARAPAVAR